MLKKVLMGAILLPFLAAASFAQDQSADHHYTGGPKTEVPHHIGPKATENSRTTQGAASQAGKHHYQGGPQAIHHIGDYPKASGDEGVTNKMKRKKKTT